MKKLKKESTVEISYELEIDLHPTIDLVVRAYRGASKAMADGFGQGVTEQQICPLADAIQHLAKAQYALQCAARSHGYSPLKCG
jgi:hypothetical protein